MKNKKWTAEQVELLKQHYPTMELGELSKLLGKSISGLRTKASKLGVTNGYYWTDEQIAILEDLKPYSTINGLAKQTGRSRQSVINKLAHMGVSVQDGREDYTLKYIEQCFGMNLSGWPQKMMNSGFKLKKVRLSNKRHIWLVNPEQFWEKIQDNPHMFDLKNYEKRTILPEPDNLNQLIEQCDYQKKSKNPWTPEEIGTLKQLYSFGYSDFIVADKLNRTEASVKNKRLRIIGRMDDI